LAGRTLSAPRLRAEPLIHASEPQFWPSRLLRNAHLQTILGNLPLRVWLVRRRAAALLARSQPWLLDCGEGVQLQAFYSSALETGRPLAAPGDRGGYSARRLAVLLHGWEGSADSSYLLSLGAALLQRGFEVLRLNLRDHGATHGLNRDIFHSCRLPEVVGAVRAIGQRLPDAQLYLAGFSLGGNFVLRVAADAAAPPTIIGAAAISPVIDPAATLTALELGASIYQRYFVRRWSRSLRIKQRAWPGAHDFGEILRLADLRAMTAALVRMSTDFPSLDAYLQGYAITGERLATLRAPASLLVAEDDPIIPAADLARLASSPRLTVWRTPYGGHCGFVDHLTRPSFADRFVLRQFEAFERGV